LVRSRRLSKRGNGRTAFKQDTGACKKGREGLKKKKLIGPTEPASREINREEVNKGLKAGGEGKIHLRDLIKRKGWKRVSGRITEGRPSTTRKGPWTTKEKA